MAIIKYNVNEDEIFKKLNITNGKALTVLAETSLRLCEPYTPFRTGTLIKSAIITSVFDKAILKWNVPYAQRLYYNPDFKFNGAPMRGAFWFERMKIDRATEIINEVRRIIKNG